MYFIGLLIEGVKATLLDIGVGLISAPLLGIMAVVDKASCEKKEKLYERHPQNSHLFIFRKVNEHPHGKKISDLSQFYYTVEDGEEHVLYKATELYHKSKRQLMTLYDAKDRVIAELRFEKCKRKRRTTLIKVSVKFKKKGIGKKNKGELQYVQNKDCTSLSYQSNEFIVLKTEGDWYTVTNGKNGMTAEIKRQPDFTFLDYDRSFNEHMMLVLAFALETIELACERAARMEAIKHGP